MKFINILVILTLVVLISCVDKKRHRSRKSNSYKSHLSSNNGTAIYGNLTNATSLKDKYLDMRNNTHTPLDTWGMYSGLKKIDYSLLSPEIQDIFQFMLYKQEGTVNKNSLRIFFEIFAKDFFSCDLDKNNLLDETEFAGCLQNTTAFRYVLPPTFNYTSYSQVLTMNKEFISTLFNIYDFEKLSLLNFNDYMKLRLVAYSWEKCSVFTSFITESNFECAHEIVAQTNVFSRTKLRNLFNFWTKLSGTTGLRELDFAMYSIIALSSRLYYNTNKKRDSDVNRKEMEIALDLGALPRRYTQDTINHFFRLVDNKNKLETSIDLLTFTYYDFFLTLFDSYSKVKSYHINSEEFEKIVGNLFFPNRYKAEMLMTPQYNITANSYGMFAMANHTIFNDEGDFFYKFSQVESEKTEVSKKKHRKLRSRHPNFNDNMGIKSYPDKNTTFSNAYGIDLNEKQTIKRYFDAIDTKMDGYVNFYDFANLMQLAQIFITLDENTQGACTANSLFEYLRSYSNLPTMGQLITSRSGRLSHFDEEALFDLLTLSTIFKFDDFVANFLKDPNNPFIYEVELKRILSRTNYSYLPESVLNQCLRGQDNNNLPLYDWDCSIKVAAKANLEYFRAMNVASLRNKKNVKVISTGIYSIDPQYQ
jgi:hypothetical protein